MILTAVEKVAINFNMPDEKWLSKIRVEEAKEYMKQGQFGVGSMQPKVQACCDFIEQNPDKTAIITHLSKVNEGLTGKTGTQIVR